MKRVGLKSAVLRFPRLHFSNGATNSGRETKASSVSNCSLHRGTLDSVLTRTADFLPDCSSIWPLNYATFSIFAKHYLIFSQFFSGGGGGKYFIKNKLNPKGNLLVFWDKNYILSSDKSKQLLTISLLSTKKEKKSKKFCQFRIKFYFCSPVAMKRSASLRYGVMVALQILALSVRVRILLSQL